MRRRWWIGLVAVLALAALAFAAWSLLTPRPLPEALAALQSDEQVSVSHKTWWVFRPADSEPTVGLILYPGARIDPRSYAPAARAIALEGYLVAIVPMPLNLAVLGSGRASGVMAAFPHVQAWAVGGHSLGGAMAIRFAHQNPQAVAGLVLWAAFGAATDDLSGFDLKVVSIYGTRDGLSSLAEIEASRALVPGDAEFVTIVGGNHAQFGWYGPQAGDQSASIDREAQQAQVVRATLSLLNALHAQVTQE